MTIFFKKIFFFFIFTIPIYFLLLILWGEFVPNKFKNNLNYKQGSIGQMQLRLEELKKLNKVDILFLGSSTSYRGFDTRIFNKLGYTSFNLGSSAQTPIQTKYLLMRYLKKANPKLLIIDVNPLMFTIDGVESSLDLISNDDFNADMIKMAMSVNNLKVYNTLIYDYFKDKIIGKKNYQTKVIRNDATYISGGYVEHKLSYFKKIQYKDQEWNYSKLQFSIFDEIITFLKSNRINYVIVQSPITPKLYFSHQNNDFFDHFMKKRGQYFNFNQIISLDDSLHFVDAYHLNQDGVEKYNDKLIQVFRQDTLKILDNLK